MTAIKLYFTFVFIILLGFECSAEMGVRTGRIVKLSKNSPYTKFWDGEMISCPYAGGSGCVCKTIKFIVDDKLVYHAYDALESKYDVRIAYKTDILNTPWRLPGQPIIVIGMENSNIRSY